MKLKKIALYVLLISLAISLQLHAGQSKTTLCHKGKTTITVADPAVVNAHMNHGDSEGACPGDSSGAGAGSGGGAAGTTNLPVEFAVCHESASYGTTARVTPVGRVSSQRVKCPEQ